MTSYLLLWSLRKISRQQSENVANTNYHLFLFFHSFSDKRVWLEDVQINDGRDVDFFPLKQYIPSSKTARYKAIFTQKHGNYDKRVIQKGSINRKQPRICSAVFYDSLIHEISDTSHSQFSLINSLYCFGENYKRQI